MACKPCQAKARARAQATAVQTGNVTKSTTMTQPGKREFVTKKYLGPTGVVNSVIPRTTYGKRESGSIMRVAVEDVNANPELWSDV